jgi:hypothetical protein
MKGEAHLGDLDVDGIRLPAILRDNQFQSVTSTEEDDDGTPSSVHVGTVIWLRVPQRPYLDQLDDQQRCTDYFVALSHRYKGPAVLSEN